MSQSSFGAGQTATLKACVRGLVQGVGFRVFIRRAAWHLEIRGFVRNMPDGTVQIVATGSPQALDKLIQEVWQGPAGAHVKSVDSEWLPSEPAGLAREFEVRL